MFSKKKYNFFMQSSPLYKACLFSALSKAYIVDIEYPQEICLPIFAIEDFSRLFAHPSIFLINRFKVIKDNAWLFGI